MGWQDDPVVTGKPKWESDPIVSPDLALAADAAPMIEIGEGMAAPALVVPSANPYSAGRYPLGRKFSVGDVAEFSISDPFSGVQTEIIRLKVTHVDAEADRVEINHGKMVVDSMGNLLSNRKGTLDVPQQTFPAELYVGKKWTAGWKFLKENGDLSFFTYDFRIVALEKLRVSAGEFQAFRIDGNGWERNSMNNKKNGQIEYRAWVVPGINFALKRNIITRRSSGKFGRTESVELISLRQQSIDTRCAAPAGSSSRNLVIRSNCA